jgi:hypothetical protein
VIIIPPAYVRVLPTAISHACVSTVVSSMVTRKRRGEYVASVRSVAST